MKILMVNKFLYPNGGSETYIFKLGKKLKELGHDVEYFGMEHKERIVGNTAQCYTSSMDFHTGKINRLLYPFKIIYSLEARRKIRKVLDEFQPDIVHLNNFNFQITPSIIYEIKSYGKKNHCRVSIIYTAHDYQWICPNHMMQIPSTGELCTRCISGRVWNCTKYKCVHGSGLKSLLGSLEAWLYKSLKTYSMVDTIICPSNFMAEMLGHNPLLKTKTVILHNFIDKKADGEEQQKQEEGCGEYVLYFGRYAKEKGIDTLLSVCEELTEIPFVFAGSGPLEGSVNKIKNIDNKGFLNGEALKQTIKNARFVVFPSEWYENCPFSVMEAQMYHIPVLGAKIGGTPELIENYKTGEWFESGNREELKTKIEALWKDKERCLEYRRNCRENSRKNSGGNSRGNSGGNSFDTLDEYCRKILKIYESPQIN